MSTSYRKKYTDPAKVESERKDIVISKLKSEAFELSKTDKEYSDSATRLINWNHKYNLLHKEKALDEKEYNERDEANKATIRALKEELQSLKAELESIQADILDQKEENAAASEIIEEKSSEIARLNCDLSEAVGDNEEISATNKDLEAQIGKLKEEIQEVTKRVEGFEEEVKEVNSKGERLENQITETEGVVENLLKVHDELKENLYKARLQLRDKITDGKTREQKVIENKKRITFLETQLKDCEAVNEELFNDVTSYQKEQSIVSKRINDQKAKIQALEELHQEKDEELEELRRQIKELRKEEEELLDENEALEHDVELSHKHLDLLTTEHYELLDEIEQVNDEDTDIRQVLQRADRLSQTKSRYEEKVKSSNNILSTSLLSPVKLKSTAISASSKTSC